MRHPDRIVTRNRTRTRALTLTLTLAFALAGCAALGTRDAPDEDAGPTILEVDNRASTDMTIHVVREGGARQRLGTATSHTRTALRIPDRLLFGPTPLRFEADPIGSTRTRLSESITVMPGDTVTMQIPFR